MRVLAGYRSDSWSITCKSYAWKGLKAKVFCEDKGNVDKYHLYCIIETGGVLIEQGSCLAANRWTFHCARNADSGMC